MAGKIRVGVLNDMANSAAEAQGDVTEWLEREVRAVQAAGRLDAEVEFVKSYGLGLPAGTEFLDLLSPQYISDLIAWGAIGAAMARMLRTMEPWVRSFIAEAPAGKRSPRIPPAACERDGARTPS